MTANSLAALLRKLEADADLTLTLADGGITTVSCQDRHVDVTTENPVALLRTLKSLPLATPSIRSFADLHESLRAAGWGITIKARAVPPFSLGVGAEKDWQSKLLSFLARFSQN